MTARRWLVVSLAVAWFGCSGATTPATPTPTPTPTPTIDPQAARLVRFVATPDTLTEGDDFTLTWEGQGGIVSLAVKGYTPFLVGQPSSGSLALSPGDDGYPTAFGDTVYRAVIGEVVDSLETTVTLWPPATPTPTPAPLPTVSISGGGSCHPSPGSPCPVWFLASGENYTQLSWSGCCSGEGREAACAVDRIGPVTCKVVATGPGGTASASATAQGLNDTPICGPSLIEPNPPHCDVTVVFSFGIIDEQTERQTCSVASVTGACSCPGCTPTQCDSTGIRTKVTAASTPGDCVVRVRYTDAWGASKECSSTATVISD